MFMCVCVVCECVCVCVSVCVDWFASIILCFVCYLFFFRGENGYKEQFLDYYVNTFI